MSTQFSSIWPIVWTLSRDTTTGQSEPGGDDNEGVLCIPQSSSITGKQPSDFKCNILDTRWWGDSPSA